LASVVSSGVRVPKIIEIG